MKIGETKELLDQIPDEHIPLLKLIDKKIDNDMDKVLNKMDSIKLEVSSINNNLGSEMKTMESKMSTMQNLLWGTIIGLGLVLIAGVVSMVIAIYNK